MKSLSLSALFAAVISTAAFGAGSNGTTLPSATVSGVTTTSPVLRSTPDIAVSAAVASSFDVPSTTTVQSSCGSCSKGNNFCGTANTAVKTQQLLTTTAVTVANQATAVNVAPQFGSADPTLARMVCAGGTVTSGAFNGSLPRPLQATDGIQTVTVNVYVSEDLTTTVSQTINNMDGPGCSGTILSSMPGNVNSGTTTKIGSGSANGTYVLDINPPTMDLAPVTSQSTIQQGTDKVVHNRIANGSAGTPYTLVDTVTGPGVYTSAAQTGDTFGPSGKGDGMGPDKHNTVGVHVACDAPPGDYSAASVVNSVDLGGLPFDPVPGSNTDSFTVIPGTYLKDDTLVLAEMPGGDYRPMSCFSSTLAANGRKVNTSPGSLHLTATVNTTGPCAGFQSISNTQVTLNIPPGFVTADSGAAPKAHIFIGPSATGFDYHYPQTLAEVTSLLPKAAISVTGDATIGQTVKVDLSMLDLSGDKTAPAIPSSDTIYVRVHAIYAPATIALPPDGATYPFSTSTSSVLPGGIGMQTNSSTQTITALQACRDGN
jgi:hypothetical protein